LTAHITSSVGWFGAVVVFLALAVAGVNSANNQPIANSQPPDERRRHDAHLMAVAARDGSNPKGLGTRLEDHTARRASRQHLLKTGGAAAHLLQDRRFRHLI
jgi:hypothetical protein